MEWFCFDLLFVLFFFKEFFVIFIGVIVSENYLKFDGWIKIYRRYLNNWLDILGFKIIVVEKVCVILSVLVFVELFF